MKRVVVRIADKSKWCEVVADALDGAHGVITETSFSSFNGHPPNMTAHLVKLDEPRQPNHSFYMPITEFWFDPSDITKEDE